MITIAPSILASDFLNLQTEIEAFDGNSNLWFHLDIMDGHYVPNLTFGQTVVKNISKVTSHKLDAHFMVNNPEDYISSFKDIGIYNFTFHWESVTHHDSLISEIKKHYPSVGIALNPGTDITVIPEYIFKEIDLILIMSVNPGFGGQSFIPSSLEKIKYLKSIKEKFNLNFQIQVDGGINDQNAPSLIKAGATNLVAGSYIFKNNSNEYPKKVESLRK